MARAFPACRFVAGALPKLFQAAVAPGTEQLSYFGREATDDQIMLTSWNDFSDEGSFVAQERR